MAIRCPSCDCALTERIAYGDSTLRICTGCHERFYPPSMHDDTPYEVIRCPSCKSTITEWADETSNLRICEDCSCRFRHFPTMPKKPKKPKKANKKSKKNLFIKHKETDLPIGKVKEIKETTVNGEKTIFINCEMTSPEDMIAWKKKLVQIHAEKERKKSSVEDIAFKKGYEQASADYATGLLKAKQRRTKLAVSYLNLACRLGAVFGILWFVFVCFLIIFGHWHNDPWVHLAMAWCLVSAMGLLCLGGLVAAGYGICALLKSVWQAT